MSRICTKHCEKLKYDKRQQHNRPYLLRMQMIIIARRGWSNDNRKTDDSLMHFDSFSCGNLLVDSVNIRSNTERIIRLMVLNTIKNEFATIVPIQLSLPFLYWNGFHQQNSADLRFFSFAFLGILFVRFWSIRAEPPIFSVSLFAPWFCVIFFDTSL